MPLKTSLGNALFQNYGHDEINIEKEDYEMFKKEVLSCKENWHNKRNTTIKCGTVKLTSGCMIYNINPFRHKLIIKSGLLFEDSILLTSDDQFIKNISSVTIKLGSYSLGVGSFLKELRNLFTLNLYSDSSFKFIGDAYLARNIDVKTNSLVEHGIFHFYRFSNLKKVDLYDSKFKTTQNKRNLMKSLSYAPKIANIRLEKMVPINTNIEIEYFRKHMNLKIVSNFCELHAFYAPKYSTKMSINIKDNYNFLKSKNLTSI